MSKKSAAVARPAKSKLDTKIIHSLDKGLEVLELVAANGDDMGLTELTQTLHWDKSTIFRLLTTLIRRGYIERDAVTKRYRLGFRVLHLERQLFQSIDMARISRDILTRLANATGEAAHLATLNKSSVIVVAQRESPERMAVNAQVGSVEPLHCTALGKAILMQFSDEWLDESLEHYEFVAFTPKTIVSRELLIANVRRARSCGYALDDEEFSPEIRCIAAPAVVHGSRRQYAIGISGPCSRVVPGRVPAMAEQVMRAAEEFMRLFAPAKSA